MKWEHVTLVIFFISKTVNVVALCDFDNDDFIFDNTKRGSLAFDLGKEIVAFLFLMNL